MNQSEFHISPPISNINFNYTVVTNGKSSIASHAHMFYELIFVVRGDCKYVEEDRLFQLNKNDFVLTRPYVHHYIDIISDDAYERYNLSIPMNHRLAEYIEALIERSPIRNCDGSRIPEILKRLLKYKKLCGEEDFDLATEAALTEILVILRLNDTSAVEDNASVNPMISKAVEYINENLFTINGVEEVCETLFISKPYFFRLFKREMHISPKKYILTKRLIAAKALIAGGERPTDVCGKAGFGNYVSFYKSYLEYFGYPPSSEGR